MTSNEIESDNVHHEDDLDATVAAKGATERDRSAPAGRKGAGSCLREVLEDEVDDEGDVEALVVGGHDDAVRALAARRRLHGRPTGHSTGSLPSPRASAPSEPRWVGREQVAPQLTVVARSPQPPLLRGGRSRRDEQDQTGWPGSSPHGHACEWV